MSLLRYTTLAQCLPRWFLIEEEKMGTLYVEVSCLFMEWMLLTHPVPSSLLLPDSIMICLILPIFRSAVQFSVPRFVFDGGTCNFHFES